MFDHDFEGFTHEEFFHNGGRYDRSVDDYFDDDLEDIGIDEDDFDEDQ